MDYIGIIKQRKIIGGMLYPKYYINSDGNEVGIPTGITLIKIKNLSYVYVSPNRKQYPDSFRVSLPYTDKATQEQAIKEAIVTISTLSKGTNRTCYSTRPCPKRTKLDSAFNIDLSEIPNGVSVYSNRDRGVTYLKIGVTCFDTIKNKFASKSLYVGTANTWKDRYRAKLQEAIALREESMKHYNELTRANPHRT